MLAFRLVVRDHVGRPPEPLNTASCSGTKYLDSLARELEARTLEPRSLRALRALCALELARDAARPEALPPREHGGPWLKARSLYAEGGRTASPRTKPGLPYGQAPAGKGASEAATLDAPRADGGRPRPRLALLVPTASLAALLGVVAREGAELGAERAERLEEAGARVPELAALFGVPCAWRRDPDRSSI